MESTKQTFSRSAGLAADPPLSRLGEEQVPVGAGVLASNIIRADLYDPVDNRNGYIDFGLAENTALWQEMIKYYDSAFSLTPPDFTYGDGITGTVRLRTACARFLNRYFRVEPNHQVAPEHIIVANGLTHSLNIVSRVVSNPGDGILLAAPYYAGFDYDFMNPLGIHPVQAQVPPLKIGTLEELEYLEEAYRSSAVHINAVVLCNPHNPVGRAYPREVVEAYCQFAQKYNLHLISDEIYAYSIYPSEENPNPTPFFSVFSLDLDALRVDRSRIHVLYGMSKDFGASGFRIGLFVSRHNEAIVKSMAASSSYMRVSSTADLLWSSLLNSSSKRNFNNLDQYLSENNQKLTEGYEYISDWLRRHGIGYIPASAGLFLMINLRFVIEDVDKYGRLVGFDASTPMAERESLLNLYLRQNRVLLTPGASVHMGEAGWFRFVFAIRADYRDVGLERLARALLLTSP